MPAALAHEQHHPIVWRSDEAMGAAKLPRGVQDRGRHSTLRLEAATLTKFIIGSTAGQITCRGCGETGRVVVGRHPGCAYSGAFRITEWVFDTGERV
jgi:hypothetical protein